MGTVGDRTVKDDAKVTGFGQRVEALLIGLGATLREITSSLLDVYLGTFMRHPDGAIKKIVREWNSVARCGFKVMEMEESPREFSWRKGPRAKSQDIGTVME